MLPAACDLSPSGLTKWLNEQRWASPPYDVSRSDEGSLIIVGGTFRMRDSEEVVREWYVTDRSRLACCSVTALADRLAAAMPACEATVRSLRFELS